MNNDKITIVGLGYVGLPLAVEFAKKYTVVGFDINTKRIDELQAGKDRTLEVEDKQLKQVLVSDNKGQNGLYVINQLEALADSNVYIITVPTPSNDLNQPVFTPLVKASESIG